MDPRAERAEQVANWYFRLNGFLSTPGFVVHPDQRQRFPLTEADLIAVRFPHSVEKIANHEMADHLLLTGQVRPDQIFFILVEVKSDLCNVNGPWSDRGAGNMQRVIKRLGFAGSGDVDSIAAKMYQDLRWENHGYVLQYVAVGARRNSGLHNRYRRLLQVTWDEIADFLFRRFNNFPEKLPDGSPFHPQWPDFGRAYSEAFPQLKSEADSRKAVRQYIDNGRCLERCAN